MPAMAVADAASVSVLSPAASPPIATSWRLPLDPSMMVTVLFSPAAACLDADFMAGSAWLEAAGAAFWSAPGVLRKAMRATGSPPKGLSVNRAMVAKPTKNRPSSTASACMAVNGSRNRRFLRAFSCPSGVLSSSAVSVMNLPESTAVKDTTMDWIRAPYRAQKPPAPGIAGAGWKPATEKGGPRAALFTENDVVRSVCRLVGGLVDRRLVAGGRRHGGGGLDAVQQVSRGLQGLVVLG